MSEGGITTHEFSTIQAAMAEMEALAIYAAVGQFNVLLDGDVWHVSWPTGSQRDRPGRLDDAA